MFKSVKELLPDPKVLDLKLDVRGWNGGHPVFAQVINQHQPDDIVEVGCWYGHGTLHLTGITTGKIFCVDTWLGGYDHLIHSDRDDCRMPVKYGYPALYHQWLFNVASSPHSHRVVPIPQTSANGARLLENAGKSFKVIIIDASHEYEDVYQDLVLYSRILKTDGAIIADDFHSHPPVHQAVLRFAFEHRFSIRENGNFVVLTRK